VLTCLDPRRPVDVALDADVFSLSASKSGQVVLARQEGRADVERVAIEAMWPMQRPAALER
jgi:hypothetical protein